jgi:hypothetical protein
MIATSHHFSVVHGNAAVCPALLSYSGQVCGRNSAAKRLLSVIGLELPANSSDSTSINNPYKGKTTCSKYPGSWLLSQLLACRPVPVPVSVTPIWSVALSALAQVWSLLESSTRIRPQLQSPASLLVCCVMTQASAAPPAKFSRAISAQGTIITAVGALPWRRFCV